MTNIVTCKMRCFISLLYYKKDYLAILFYVIFHLSGYLMGYNMFDKVLSKIKTESDGQ